VEEVDDLPEIALPEKRHAVSKVTGIGHTPDAVGSFEE